MSKVRVAMICGKMCEAPEGDYFVTCSFDKNHILLRSRMPYHIVKCKKNHPGHNKMQCPYDATEYIDHDDFASHLLTCEARRSISSGKYDTAALKLKGKVCNIKQTPFFHSSVPESEDWEVETEPSKKEEEDDPEPLPLKGVGRGMSLKKPLPIKGKGRAELLSRFMKMYERRQDTSSSSSVCSSDNISAARTEITPGQFDDEWEF